MSFTYKSSGTKSRPEREKSIPVPGTPPRYRRDSESSIDSFASAVSKHDNTNDHDEPLRFTAEEEQNMRSTSTTLRLSANKQFQSQDFSSAISTYEKSLAELPVYLDYEVAVLQSNIAACHIQLKEWKDAIEAAEKGLESLEREWPTPKPKPTKKSQDVDNTDAEDSKVIELPEENTEADNAALLKELDLSDQKKTDIIRIRTKLYLRRARAKISFCDEPTSTTTKASTDISDSLDDPPSTKPKAKPDLPIFSHWSNLSTALSDYQTLSREPYLNHLPPADRRTVMQALHTLPPRIEQAKKKEMDEMLGKLKGLGDMVLKPFGLSTDMFKMKQNADGSWGMNVESGGKKSD